MRLAALVSVGCVLTAGIIADTSVGATTHPRQPARVCHRRHGHRICTKVRAKPRRPPTPTRQTSVTSTQSVSAPPTSTTTTSQTTTSTQTTATQTVTTSSSTTTSSLPHGTQVTERATGQQSPFYALSANESTFASGTIRFNVYNTDQDPHTFAVADANGNQLTDATPIPAGHPQTPVTVTVTLPPGTYVLFCTLPQHAASGMKTTIVVR